MDASHAQPEPVFASAVSVQPEAESALSEVLDRLGATLPARADVVVAFVTMGHAEALRGLVAHLRDRMAPKALIACTCEGVIGVRREIETGPALSVLAGSLPGVEPVAFSYDQLDIPAVIDAPAALRDSLPRVVDRGDARAFVMLADPFSTPMVKLLPAFDAAFPGVPVVGGMASGAARANQNRLILDDREMRDGAVGLALCGSLDVRTTVSQGCRPVGKPFVVTKAKRHIVQELGGFNALDAVATMAKALDSRDQHLLTENGVYVGRVVNEYQERFGRGDFLIRNVVGVDPSTGYLAIDDPQVRVGQTLQLHVRDADAATHDFEMLLQAQRLYGRARGALLFSCTSRGSRLFGRQDADADAVHAALGEVPMAGFFAAGELGPIGGESHVHGHAASLVVFRAEQP